MAGVTSPATADELADGAFARPIRRVWISPVYLVGLVIVAAAMIVLPLIYLGLIGLTAYGIYYHATEHLWILTSGGMGRTPRLTIVIGFLRVIAYGGPLAIGVVVVVFMIKPLFARPARREKRVSFVRENEPTLFAFVDALCETVRAPRPRRIDIDCDLTASAGFRRGLLSMFGRDMVLTMGAPLVAGMPLREFAGVLAHELGHFSQAFATRLTYIIGRINRWFARVVYERDTWDLGLVGLSEADEWYFSLVFLLARFFVGLTRCVLWVLMWIGHLISCGMLRQMERDADRYYVRVAGSDGVESGLRRLVRLQGVAQAVVAELDDSWRERRLPDNYPLLLAAKAEDMPRQIRDQIDQSIDAGRTGILDTHPSIAERIRRARKQGDPGVFRGHGPASALFSDFPATCKAATLSFYHDVVGPGLRPDQLVSTDDLARRQQERQRGASAARRYFQGCLTPRRPIRIDRYGEVFQLAPKACIARLERARAALLKALPVLRKTYGRYAEACDRAEAARVAHALLRAGVKIDAQTFNLSRADADEAWSALSRAQREQQRIEPELAKIEAVIRLRLECGLALLRADQLQSRVRGIDRLRDRTATLLDALGTIQALTDSTDLLREKQPTLKAMATALARDDSDENLIGRAVTALREQHGRLAETRSVLNEQPYPFRHADGNVSMARYALESLPDSDDLPGTIDATDHLLASLDSLYGRVMGNLARTAEAVEAALGFSPLGAGATDRAPRTSPTGDKRKDALRPAAGSAP